MNSMAVEQLAAREPLERAEGQLLASLHVCGFPPLQSSRLATVSEIARGYGACAVRLRDREVSCLAACVGTYICGCISVHQTQIARRNTQILTET